MIEPASDRRAPMAPPLALRVAMLGGVAFVLFAIILFRLWYLQVLSGPQYVQLANDNRVRDIAIAAPRGEILDSAGNAIVANVVRPAVQIVPTLMPHGRAQRIALFDRLGRVLSMAPSEIASTLDDSHNYSYANVTIQTPASEAALVYLKENAPLFPEVDVEPVEVRKYPYTTLAAQVLGSIGQINSDELGKPGYEGIPEGTVIGQGGLESTYDRYLRGRDGADHVEVDPAGSFTGSLPPTLPIAGHDVRLSINLGLQQEGEKALQTAMGLAQSNGLAGNAGAFVALDPNNGQVLAMGSYPNFDPSVFTKTLSNAQYAQLTGDVDGAPGALFNRAIDGLYPVGSTFKPFTALAALNAGLITTSTLQGGGSCVTVGAAHQKFCNSGKTNYGDLDLTNALQVSEDTYFYEVGEKANGSGDVIQNEAREFGFGSPTGIDLPGEEAGTVPDRKVVNQINTQYEQLCKHNQWPDVEGTDSCDYPGLTPWTVGQNMNLAVGQGYFLATPLQMAVAYSALFNGGNVWVPHLAQEIDDSQGRLIQAIQPTLKNKVSINPVYQQAIAEGLHLAASTPSGTSGDVFAGWPQSQYPVYGKTGTAQHGDLAGSNDQSWYMCYVPAGKRSIVLAITVEHGGFGAQAAAPAARLMLSEWFHQPLKVVVGTSQTQ